MSGADGTKVGDKRSDGGSARNDANEGAAPRPGRE
jgi:hypothetical protein